MLSQHVFFCLFILDDTYGLTVEIYEYLFIIQFRTTEYNIFNSRLTLYWLVVHDWLWAAFQIVDPDPYLQTHGGQTTKISFYLRIKKRDSVYTCLQYFEWPLKEKLKIKESRERRIVTKTCKNLELFRNKKNGKV